MSLTALGAPPPCLRRLLLPALMAGLVAGLVTAILQQLFLVPLILRAEAAEMAGHAHAAAAVDIERTLYSLLFTCLGTFGFALLLAGCYALRGGVSWRRGSLWGLAGFVSFWLAPALGLPPELPGAHVPDLLARQVWWIATAVATAAGLTCVVFPRAVLLKLLGVVLIVLPHLIGAPRPIQADSDLPADLVRAFVVGSMTVSAVMWLILGPLTSALMKRYIARPD